MQNNSDDISYILIKQKLYFNFKIKEKMQKKITNFAKKSQ